jgi:hypothetical protein
MHGMVLHTDFPNTPHIFVLYVRDAFYGRESAFPVWNDTCPAVPGGAAQGCAASGTLSRLEFRDFGGSNIVSHVR